MSRAIRRRLDRLRGQVARTDLGPSDKAVMLSESALKACLLWPRVAVGRAAIYELTAPPAAFRGFSDLSVRAGTLEDVDRMAGMLPEDPTAPALIRARFAAGDAVFVGELEGQLLAHSWFHAGPVPFHEDTDLYGSFVIDPGDWWSYHAVVVSEARTSGVFIKVFQSALRSIFLDSGAKRILCAVKTTNRASVAMHDRLGFRRIGTIGSVLVPGLRWLRWSAEGGARNWLRPRSSPPLLSIPQPKRT
jgi:hypothetical protein